MQRTDCQSQVGWPLLVQYKYVYRSCATYRGARDGKPVNKEEIHTFSTRNHFSVIHTFFEQDEVYQLVSLFSMRLFCRHANHDHGQESIIPGPWIRAVILQDIGGSFE